MQSIPRRGFCRLSQTTFIMGPLQIEHKQHDLNHTKKETCLWVYTEMDR